MPDGQIGMPGEKGALVVVAGRQRVGKTTVANALVQYYSALGCRFEVWNADQQNRSHSLSSFFADALTPPQGGMVDGRMWLEQRLRDQVRRRSNAVLDPGGGWTSFASLVREIPLVTALDAEGFGLSHCSARAPSAPTSTISSITLRRTCSCLPRR